MKEIYIVILTLFFSLVVNSQTIEPYFSMGKASCKLGDFKTLFNSITEQVPIEIQTTSYFPDYFTYDGGVNVKFSDEKLEAGFSINYASSGSRANYIDYSGLYNVDFLANATGLSGSFGARVFNTKWIVITSKLRLSLLLSNLKIKEEYRLYDVSDNMDINLKSKSFSSEPVIELSKNFKHWGVFANTGYLFDFTGKIHLADDNNSMIQINDKDAVSDWSGFRVRFGVKFIIKSSVL